MKIYMDDVRQTPPGYTRVYTVQQAVNEVVRCNKETDFLLSQYILGYIERELFDKCMKIFTVEEISCDNDLGDGEPEGYKLLDWLEATGRNIPIRIHSANPVARQRMELTIQRNGWTEVR